MTFKPTHEFRGLELEYVCDNSYMHYHSYYRTRDDHQVSLPEQLVTKIIPKPQPGEVWKYTGYEHGPYSLVLITTDDVPSFVNEEGDTISFDGDGHMSNFVKILNADGSLA